MTYTRKRNPGCPLPVEPQVLSIELANLTDTAIDIPVYVPWKNVELTYAYSVCTAAVDTSGDLGLKFELNAASGTSLGVMTIPVSTTAGTQVDWTAGTATQLSSDNTSIDAVNIEYDGNSGAGSGKGTFTVFMYFEKYRR